MGGMGYNKLNLQFTLGVVEERQRRFERLVEALGRQREKVMPNKLNHKEILLCQIKNQLSHSIKKTHLV